MNRTFNLRDIRAAAIDMDGVLWRGDEPISGLQAFFGLLRSCSIPFVLATNNASKTPGTYVERLRAMGVTIEAEEVLTSSLAIAGYLREIYPDGTKAYAVGGKGLHQALADAGFRVLPDASEPADIVAAGIDFDLTYDKLACAALHIQWGARFFGTNSDRSYPAETGHLPAAGAILSAIETATGVAPTIIGKPNRRMFDVAIARLGTPREATVMIGDRLETDILGAQQAGLWAVLVTSGIDNATTVRDTGIEPDAIYPDIGVLAEAWRGELAEVGDSPRPSRSR
jgi:4-nitrophenyl phosphatase